MYIQLFLMLTTAVLIGCDGAEQIADTASQPDQVWTCGMHPDVLVRAPGQCPICKMDLVKAESARSMEQIPDQSVAMVDASESQGRKILYWRAPMDPTYVSDKPGKSPMGMDLVPVYEGEKASTGPAVVIDPVTMQNIGVQTTSVRRENLYRSIRAVSHVDYNEETFSRVNIKYSGWIERMFVDQTGQAVRAGQPMLEVYSPELVSTQEEYLLAYRNSQRLGDSSVTSIASGARSLLKAARRRLQYWDITDGQIQALENRGSVTKSMTIYAPSNGFVVEKHAEQGMRVIPGMDLYRLADLSTVWLFAHFYEQEAPWIKQGQTVEMSLPYNPGKMYRGRVDYVYPYLDQKTRDLKVRLVFPNPRLELKPNMYANVNLKVHMRDAVVVVPDDAILRSGTRDIVFIALGGGKFEPREVVLGVKGQGGLVQILAGVAPSEKVVTSAQFLLDSESRLKEAILKMLAPRRQMRSGGTEGQPIVIKPQ
ncbi:MAG: efflux RND transporter periplasmic adaptor subunit [Gemmatimonadota bacterium]|nr:efflux RND transporter periplasmic adaptor subunit [Gemmatimonadota bacterium]